MTIDVDIEGVNVRIDTRLVTADELVRNIDEHIAGAAGGNPVVVLGDGGNAPAVALVRIDDLKYLGRALAPTEPIAAAGDYASVLAATPAGHTPIGVHPDRTPAAIVIRGHHLIVARDGSGVEGLLSSAISGAALSCPASELGFVVATSAARAELAPRLLEAAHVVSYQPDLREESLLARFVEHLAAEVRTRRDALRHLRLRSVDERRSGDSEWLDKHPELADLVVVIDRVGELIDLNGDLNRLINELLIAEGSLGIHLWMVNPTPLTSVAFKSVSIRSLMMDVITSRIALQTFSPGHSESTVGIPDAAFISEPGVGFCKSDNLTAARRFAVVALAQEELDVLADTAAGRTGHHMFGAQDGRPRWAEALPDVISLNDTIERWEAADGARNTASVPIGLVDNTNRHQISPFTITFNETLRALVIVGGNAEHLTAVVEAITSAAAVTNSKDALRFVYVGPSATDLRPLWTNGNVDMVNINDQTKIGTVIAELKHQIDLPSRDGHTVLIIDGWDRWQSVRLEDSNNVSASDLIVEIARRGPAANIHLIVTGPVGYYTSQLDSVTDERIELRLRQAYESKIDQTAAAVIPDDHRHGLTRQGRLLIIDG